MNLNRSKIAVVSTLVLAVAACTGGTGQPDNQANATTVANAAEAVAGTSVERLDPALDAVIAPGTAIEKVAGGFTFAEGPMWHEGRLWFSDVPESKLIAVTADGKVETLIENSGGTPTKSTSKFKGSNGMVTDKDGSVLLVQHSDRRIVRLDGKLGMIPFLDKFEGKRFNSPNDLVFAPDGSLWFTDPPFGLAGQLKDPAKEIPFSGVYRYAGGKLTAAVKDLPFPNGLGFSPDGKILYVSNSLPDMALWRYDVAADGTVSNGKALVRWPGTADDVPDGLKVDSAGNIWASGPGGIRIIAPDGRVLGQIKLPEVAANLGWADNGKTVYIAGSSSIYRLKLAGKGEMPLYVKP
jgi:gluconolactonase